VLKFTSLNAKLGQFLVALNTVNYNHGKHQVMNPPKIGHGAFLPKLKVWHISYLQRVYNTG